jgi:upstream activation factor subunit UAF30
MSKLVTSKTATKTTRSKTTPKPKEVVIEEPVVVETPVVEEPVVETTTPVVEETTEIDSMKQRFERLIKTKQDLMLELKREVQELKKMQRDHELAIKEASKRSRKKRVRDENSTRKPSGFASPVIVSDELYSFLESFGVKKGDPIARTDVTRYVTTYIKDKDLQNPENRREIVPDTVLDRLFGPAMEHKDPNDATSPLVYTYLKLQRYLSQHFPKKASA